MYGESVKSPEGSGAEIQLMPDAPVSLQNDATITSETKNVIGNQHQHPPKNDASDNIVISTSINSKNK